MFYFGSTRLWRSSWGAGGGGCLALKKGGVVVYGGVGVGVRMGV